MTKQPKSGIKVKITNFVGGVGYIFCTLQWAWVIVLYFSLIESLSLFLNPKINNHPTETIPAVNMGPNIFLTIMAVTVMFTMLGSTIYILLKMPSTIAKSGRKVTHDVAENIVPFVLKIQHKKDTPKNHIKLTPRLVLIIKIILLLAPVILSFLSQFMDKQMIDFYIAMYISVSLVCFTMLFFIAQYSLAKLFSIKRQDIW